MSKIDIFPYPTIPAKIWGVPFGVGLDPSCWGLQWVKWLGRKHFHKKSNLYDHDTLTLQTDGQTDRQTTCLGNTALRVGLASRGKNQCASLRLCGSEARPHSTVSLWQQTTEDCRETATRGEDKAILRNRINTVVFLWTSICDFTSISRNRTERPLTLSLSLSGLLTDCLIDDG